MLVDEDMGIKALTREQFNELQMDERDLWWKSAGSRERCFGARVLDGMIALNWAEATILMNWGPFCTNKA